MLYLFKRMQLIYNRNNVLVYTFLYFSLKKRTASLRNSSFLVQTTIQFIFNRILVVHNFPPEFLINITLQLNTNDTISYS